jgi:hypothetical protein
MLLTIGDANTLRGIIHSLAIYLDLAGLAICSSSVHNDECALPQPSCDHSMEGAGIAAILVS